ncbi:Uncharacterized protein TCAP_02921 [Tolypocladium capitatum]|uniref:Borealin N-terminal domain-containing protein n=1 Tax=Tolypocladium capitatum TaxID=45235 RepID=A0A2K3QI13_9HYPO|nr:Uncharacterized protein TCAP_02921 [Tolypocladium capitatum]
MAPVRQKKRVSDQSTASTRRHGASTDGKMPLKDDPSTPRHRSPIKKQRMGISVQQKQALIDNLQLEVTERARRLRAQYNLQALGLRSRIEIRINRIPTSLRKTKMGDLLVKYIEQEQNQIAGRPPPVPANDTPRSSPQKSVYGAARSQAPGRAYKGMDVHSNELTRDKENEMENMDQKRKIRGAQGTESGLVRPAQVLSPTSSNSRLANRHGSASPTKSQTARHGSPLKSSGGSRSAVVTSVLSSMVERAKATRHGGTRKATTASEASSSSNATTSTTRTKGRRPVAAAATASRGPPSRPATRAGGRASGTSETSDASTGTVVKKAGAGKAVRATKKTTTMGTIRKGVAGGAKRATAKPAAASTSASGRVLRKRG